MINENSTEDYFKVSEGDNATPIEAAIKLLSQDFIELNRAGEVDAATKLFIDRPAQVFWFCDNTAMTTIERVYKMHNAQVTEVDLQEIDGWFQAVTTS